MTGSMWPNAVRAPDMRWPFRDQPTFHSRCLERRTWTADAAFTVLGTSVPARLLHPENPLRHSNLAGCWRGNILEPFTNVHERKKCLHL
jgi:hypothetical protein